MMDGDRAWWVVSALLFLAAMLMLVGAFAFTIAAGMRMGWWGQ